MAKVDDTPGQDAQLAVASKSRTRPVTILTDDNFNVWKWNLKYNLKSMNVYECICKEDTGTEKQQDEAMLEIISTLDDKIKIKVSHCKKPFELFQAIEAIYTNKTSFQVTALHMKLSSFKFKSSEQISQGISEIQSIVSKLKNLGETVSEHMVEGIVLAALPSSYRTFVTVWKGMGASERNLGNLFNRILAEVEDNKLFNTREDKALFIQNKNNFRPKFKGNFKGKGQLKTPPSDNKSADSKKTCYHCKKVGHIKKECRKLKREQEQGKIGPTGNNFPAKTTALMALTHGVDYWIADSGASCHMTSRQDWITDYESFGEPKNIFLADSDCIKAYGSGKVITTVGTLHDVYFVPKLMANLFSIVASTNKGLKAKYDVNSFELIQEDRTILKGVRQDGVYRLDFEIIAPNSEIALTARTLDDWHQRFGHVSTRVIESMAKRSIVQGLELKARDRKSDCEDCAKNKGHAVPHKTRSTTKADLPGTSLHFDTEGPLPETSLGGSKYFVLCKDEASAYRKISFVESKDEIPAAVKAIITESEFETKNKVARICSDNGTEFKNKKVASFLQERGIKHELSAPYTPQQNGYIERDIRTILEATRTMLNSSDLPKKLWAEAANTAVYIMNRVPTTSKPEITPFESWFKRKPDVKNLRIFGQKAIVNRPLVYRSGKWDLTGDVMYFVGYTQLTNTYRFYSNEKEKIVISCDVVFLDKHWKPVEPNAGGQPPTIEEVYEVYEPESRYLQVDEDEEDDDTEFADYEPGNISRTHEDVSSSHSSIEEISATRESGGQNSPIQNEQLSNSREVAVTQPSVSGTVQRSVAFEIPRQLMIRGKPPQIMESRLRQRSGTFSKSSGPQNAHLSTLEADEDPSSYRDAMRRPDSSLWKKAMQEEMDSLHKNNVWVLVDKPKDTNIVTNRWVLKIKRRPTGEIERYRARLVARGFTQIQGVDYDETYAPVVNMTTIRLLFAHAAASSLHFRQFDIKTAFLYGNLEEEVYMEQPEGFTDNTNRVCLLKKSLYGLKQSPRQWNKEFATYLKTLNLVESKFDRCVFYRTKPTRIYLAIYVDDGIIFAEDRKQIDRIISDLKRRFEVHDTSSDVFLGFQIRLNADKSISLHQESYIKKVLKKFNMADAKSIDNPSSLTVTANDKPIEEGCPFREAVGSLNYAGNTTRVDITYAVNRVSRQVANPKASDWSAVKRIMRYLKDKENLCITYSKRDNNGLIAYCDADFAGDDSRKSTTGYVILFAGGPIQWKTQKQPLTSLSSTEAELVAVCTLAKELIVIRFLAIELGIIDEKPTTMLCDNQAAIKLAISEGSVQRTRHMGVRASFMRDHIEANELAIEYVCTEDQAADFLTKALSYFKFAWNRSLLMTFLTFLLTTIVAVSGKTFEYTSPIIWFPTNNFVDDGITEYNIALTIINPCEPLRQYFGPRTITKRQIPPSGNQQGGPSHQQNGPPHPLTQNQFLPPGQQVSPVNNFQGQVNNQQSSVAHAPQEPAHLPIESRIAEHIVQECNHMFDTYYMGKVRELKMRSPKYRGARNRRHVLNEVVETTAELVCAGCVTNIISALFQRWYPKSDHNRINFLEESNEQLKRQTEQFKTEFNVTHEVQNGILQTLMSFHRDLREQQRQLQVLTDLLPTVSWSSAFVQSRITQGASDLRTIIDEYSSGRVACKEMANLLNLDELREIDNYDTRFESITSLPGPANYLFKFTVRKKSKTTFVYKVGAFKFWDNLTEVPTLMEYRGHNYLIHNETNNCLKAIEEPTQRAVLEVCTEQNSTDPRLQVWEKLVQTRDVYSNKHNCQVKRTLLYHYIYCFPFNITLKLGTFRNPPHVYRLPINEAFVLPMMNYTPVVRRLDINGPFEFPAIDSIHLGHFPMNSDAIDEVKWFDKIQHLLAENQKLTDERDQSISIEKHGTAFWFLIIFIVLLTLATAGLILYNITLNQTTTRGHHRIVHELSELKSNYCEVKTVCTGCSPRPKDTTMKEKPKIEVGKDSSITINVNRPLPKAPDNISIC